ncbi:hypothetical protein P8C59_000919 [Phyllachora maydis]|uniref:Reverse transcriptase Ty1/copia-type domain-containing protein n=1 Tax=Phyllachora maydis TaxID=1825666 RepID=A0AAD9HYE2_9PEZI|nr:hypothetical protein P8C59_000919 [Phyllachora maydis]
MLGLIASSLNIEYLIADILEESRNPAIKAYRAAYVAKNSNSTPNSNSNPSKKGKNKKKGKKKASYNIKGQNYSAKSAEQASFILGSYYLAVEEEEESDSSSNSNHISNSKERPASIGSITLEVLSRKAPPTYTKLVLDNVLYLPNININIVSRVSSKPILYANFAFPLGLSSYTTKSIEPQRNKIVVEIPFNSIRKEDYRPIIEDAIVSKAIEPNKRYKLRNSPAKGTTLEGIGPSLRGKRPYRPTREPKPLTGTRDLPRMLREPVIEGNKVEKAISSPTLKEPNIGQRDYYNLLNLAKLWWVFNLPNKLGPIVANAIKGFFRGLRNGFGRYPTKFHFDGDTEITDLLTTWLAKRVELVNSTAITNKETTPFQALFDKLEPGIPHIPNLERYRAIGAKGEAIIPLEKRSKSLKFTSRTEEYKLLVVLGSKTYLVYIPSRRAVLKTSTVKFIEDNTVLSQPTNNTALEGELVDLDLDLEGAVSPDPSNLNTKKLISIEIGPSKLEPYKSSSDKPIFAPKPIEVIAPNQPITNEPLDNNDLFSEGDKMQLDYYKLLAKTSSYILSFVYKARKRVLSKDKLGVFKFLPRSLLPSNCKLITCRNVLKVKKDAKNRPIKYKSRLVARGFIQVEGLDYTITYASTSIPPTWRILLAKGAFLDWEIEQADFIGAFLNSALREEIYIEIPKGLLDLAASNKAIYKLLLKYSYNPSTPNIIKLSKALYGLKQSPREWQDKLKILLKSLGYLPFILDPGVFYNAKTCYFIVTYVDDCLFIGPNIGYITDLKKRLNKVYAIEDLGPAAYFLGWLSRSLNRPTKSHLNAAKNLFKYLNSTRDYSICFSCNGNTVANLGPKLSNSSNTTTKLSRDFHSKEGPRPLTTTSTTIVDSRNSKGSSQTSIINSSLVPIGFSDSDFTGDKATSKSTYGYLYKLAAAYKAKQRKSAKACATAGRAAAAKRRKKRKEAHSKRTTGGDAGRYTTNSGLIANKDDNNAYNRAYMPPTKAEEEEEKDGSSDNNSVNSSTSNSTNKGKGSSTYKHSKGTLHYKDSNSR